MTSRDKSTISTQAGQNFFSSRVRGLYGPGLAFMSPGPGSAALILKVSEQSLARDGYVSVPLCTNPQTDSMS